MPADNPSLLPPPTFEQKTVHILVRWLILILAFHFLAWSGIRAEEFSLAIRICYFFIASNLLLMAIPPRYFASGLFSRWLVGFDLAFIAACLYFLREPGAFYHWLYILLSGLLAWRRDLREVLIALAAGLALLGLAAYAATGQWWVSSDSGAFLRTSILFAMGGFYCFVLKLLDRNARLFHIVALGKQEWERTADAMSELIVMLDEEGRIRRVNQAFASRLGKKPAQLVGQRWYAVLDGSDTPGSNSPLAQALRSKATVEASCTHVNLSLETQSTAIPLLEGQSLVGAIYVLRPRTGKET